MQCHACPYIWTEADKLSNWSRDNSCPACQAPTVVPLPGPQTEFMNCTANICIFGGGVGGSKTFALTMECVRHIDETNFTAVVFRRSSPEIIAPGGPWDTAASFYPDLGLAPRRNHQYLDWRNDKGSTVKFSHLYRVEDKEKHKGAQYALICWDELTGFTEEQFTYLMSRNRAAAGCNVEPYMRATTNPDSDSWVRDWIAPWVVPSHALYGTIKYGEHLHFRRFEDEIPSSVKEFVVHREPEGARGRAMVWVRPECPLSRSLTYIPSRISDNPKFADGVYESSIHALSRVERIRLLGEHPHCWLIGHAAGEIFNRDWFVYLSREDRPVYVHTLRYWDFAASKGKNDWTSGVKIGLTPSGRFGVIDVRRGQWSAAQVEAEVCKAATLDGCHVTIYIEEDKGSAGKNLVQVYRSLLANLAKEQGIRGYTVKSCPVTGDKVVRSSKASARNEQRLIDVHPGEWREEFVAECDGFPTAKHDDMVDCLSGGINMLAPLSRNIQRFRMPRRKR